MHFFFPLENIVVRTRSQARFAYSLFSPLSHSLFLALRAVVLQARAVCFANRRKKEFKSLPPKQKDTVWCPFVWRRWRGNKVSKCVAFLLPTRKHSRFGTLDGARFRHSLFSPLSHSLFLALRAVVLQARAVCFAKRRKKSSNLSRQNKKDTDWCPFVWRRWSIACHVHNTSRPYFTM